MNQMLSKGRISSEKVINIKIVFIYCKIDDKVIQIITKNCNDLREIDFNYYQNFYISEDVFVKFGQKFGHNLVKI